MKVNEVIAKYKAIAPKRKRGVRVYSMKKKELINLIQTTEGNSPCFKNGITNCGQTDCCWYSDCQKK